MSLLLSAVSQAKLRQNYEYESKFSYAAGLKTAQILGVHQAKDPLREQGGGYRLMQSGLELKSTYYIDDDNKFRIPLTLDYIFFRSIETISYRSETDRYTHDVNILSLSTGLNYSFAYFYTANAWVYAGLEFTGNYFHNVSYDYLIQSNIDETEIFRISEELRTPNNEIWRFGTLAKLGFEAELEKRLMINFSLNLHLVNLLGRDDSTGELFVVSSLDDTESYLTFLNISLLLQYRI